MALQERRELVQPVLVTKFCDCGTDKPLTCNGAAPNWHGGGLFTNRQSYLYSCPGCGGSYQLHAPASTIEYIPTQGEQE